MDKGFFELDQVSGIIEEIEDCTAEKLSGGSFRYNLGDEEGVSSELDIILGLRAIPNRIGNTLGLVNTGPSAGDNFTVTYFDTLGGEITVERVTFGNGTTFRITDEVGFIQIEQEGTPSSEETDNICPQNQVCRLRR